MDWKYMKINVLQNVILEKFEGAKRKDIVFEDFWKWEKPVQYGMESIDEVFHRVY